MAFIQNFISRKFAEAVVIIKERGTGLDFKNIAEAIEWDSSSLSQVLNNSRNVPPEIIKRFQQKYNVKILADPEEVILTDFEERLIRAEGHLEVYENVLAGLLIEIDHLIHKKKERTPTEFTDTVASLRLKVQEAQKRRFEKLNGK